MNIKASNGCWLTQSQKVAITERLFVKEVTVSTAEETASWAEITDNEKKEMEAQEAFFHVEKVDMNYLHQVDGVLVDVSEKINDAELTNNESLEMQKYYPRWDNIQGRQVFAGYRFNCDGILYEALEPHTITEDKRPVPANQPMLMSLAAEEEPQPEKHNYYKEVLPDLYKENNVEQSKK